MGECLISRRGSESLYKLPVLDSTYPKDVKVTAALSGTVSFSVSIAEHGKPAEYTYQWYVNGNKVSGATSAIYNVTDIKTAGNQTIYCEVTNKAGTVTSRMATLAIAASLQGYSYSSSNHTRTYEDSYNINWNLTLRSTGTLKFNADTTVDIFLCAGGNGGGHGGDNSGGRGGTGGGCINYHQVKLTAGTSYTVTIGAGAGEGGTGGTTSFTGTGISYSIAGGKGAGGGSGGNISSGSAGGTGVRPFSNMNINPQGQATAYYYGGGGGGGAGKYCSNGAGGASGGGKGGSAGAANSGGGGGGADGSSQSYNSGRSGGSGIVIVRNAR
jgi:hypothetical protein